MDFVVLLLLQAVSEFIFFRSSPGFDVFSSTISPFCFSFRPRAGADPVRQRKKGGDGGLKRGGWRTIWRRSW